ncbi:hypothetical protein EKN09_02270 [Vibrio penaeicida]|nr:hypothetical protein EKN09_02270 [Vibrio penaeicida]
MCSLVTLSKYLATKSKRHRAGTPSRTLRAAFVAYFYCVIAHRCRALHRMSFALYKSPTNCCKNHLERSTDPNLSFG